MNSRPWLRRSGATGPPVGPQIIDTGTAEVVRDRTRARGYFLIVNGFESSHVDLDDPARLEFEYMQWFAAIIDAFLDRLGRSDFRALHLGAGGCAMPRYLLARHPRSAQLAVEIDGRLAALVRDWFELPRAPALRIRVGDARSVVADLLADGFDLAIRDAFRGDVTPNPLTSLEFVQQVHRVLRPGGLYVVNCADDRAMALSRHEAATLRAVFGSVVLVSDTPILKGHSRGNVVIAGCDEPIGGPALAARLLRGPAPATLWTGDQVDEFIGRATPLRDADWAD